MNKLTVDIFEEFLNNISLDALAIESSFDNVNNYTLIKIDGPLYHLRNNRSAIFETAGELTVQNVNVDDSTFTVAGDKTTDIQVMSKVTIIMPFYFHGTPLMTKNHIAGVEDKAQTPMIYLREVLREVTPEFDSPYMRIADFRLFFIDNANIQDWMTDDHYSKRLKGLNHLSDKIIDELRSSETFNAQIAEFERYNRPNWGEYSDLKGYEKTIFSGNYTAVELNSTIPIYKQDDCNF